jgi:DNA-binding transcriptional LysR family regulator
MSSGPCDDRFRDLEAILQKSSSGPESRLGDPIANLVTQLGVTLFDRLSTKKPQLTLEGRKVLAEAKSVAHGTDNVRAKVKACSAA